MEHVLLVTGIGGQGVQLAAHVLARAATAEDLEVQLFGSYAGMMRGGSTEATLVVGDGPVESPPTVDLADAAILMHHEHAAGVLSRLRPGALTLVNTTVFTGDLGGATLEVLEVPAGDLALGIGHVMVASMVMAGAFASATGLLSLDTLCAAVPAALPSYRSQHIERNVAAVRTGFELASSHARAEAVPR